MNLVEISELFTVSYGNKLDMNKMTKVKDGIAFVNRTGFNNGVVADVKEIPGVQPYRPGVLTIALGGSVLSTFLQIKPFYTGQNVAVAIPKTPMSEARLLYYATAIKANRFRYSTCGREANRTFRSLLVPSLEAVPAWIDGAKPDMFDGANAPHDPLPSPDLLSVTWKLFTFEDVFEIKKGRRLTKANMVSGSIPFIGAIDSNNGVANFVNSAIHAGNTISVNYNGAGVAEAFYQPVPYWASDDVNVLYPRFDLTPAIAMFIATIIRQEKYRFSYGRKWHLERMKTSTLPLPITQDETPDWDFMERYIATLPYSSQIV